MDSKNNNIKLNCRQCRCGKVWLAESQAVKVPGLKAGWYKNKEELAKICEDYPQKVSIRFSISKRGWIVCPDCR